MTESIVPPEGYLEGEAARVLERLARAAAAYPVTIAELVAAAELLAELAGDGLRPYDAALAIKHRLHEKPKFTVVVPDAVGGVVVKKQVEGNSP